MLGYSEAYLAVIEPIREAGMQDYRLDAIERPERHPATVDRLTGQGRSAPVDYSGWELRAARSTAGVGQLLHLLDYLVTGLLLSFAAAIGLTIVFPG
jgi:hypothetical protein